MALTEALQVYCREHFQISLRQFAPYAVQQGEGARKYCADLLGMLGTSELILLEIKELDCQTGRLSQFNTEQHAACLKFETLGVPLAYAYNKVAQLAYDKSPQPLDWPLETLESINRSLPSKLITEKPEQAQHESMLTWLNKVLGSQGRDQLDYFGRVLGAVQHPSQLRNGILVLLFSVEKEQYLMWERDDVISTLNILQNNARLSARQQGELTRLLGESSKVLAQFPPAPTVGSRQRPPSGRP